MVCVVFEDVRHKKKLEEAKQNFLGQDTFFDFLFERNNFLSNFFEIFSFVRF